MKKKHKDLLIPIIILILIVVASLLMGCSGSVSIKSEPIEEKILYHKIYRIGYVAPDRTEHFEIKDGLLYFHEKEGEDWIVPLTNINKIELKQNYEN